MSINKNHVQDAHSPSQGDDAGDAIWRNNSGEPSRRSTRMIEDSIDHMLRHLARPLRVSSLSSATGFSESHFAALFKSATGSAPKRFFLRLQMQCACKMLAVRNASVKEVALALGYRDQFYFSRVFKSVIGIAPHDYRQEMSALNQSPRTQHGRPNVQKKVICETPL